jgi:MYXO-CTERM domain-containing protein
MISLNVVRVLTWQSSAEPGSFYFGWEDDGQSSDDNFNDLVTRVGGIACNGGGATCDTGQKGACAAGTLQCRAGALSCVPDQDPIPEICNAVDDDCDGMIDEGDDICPQNFVCSRGTCVHKCSDSEFYPCPIGFTCDSAGVCRETTCNGVTCPPGQLCRGGQCRAECDGIVCPHGQACRRGGCVDVCLGLKCDPNFACVVKSGAAGQAPVGVCTTCSCKGCPAGTACVNNACRPSDCAAVTCAPGTHCEGGKCLDSCAGAKCPTGTLCKEGQCVSDGIPRPDAGAGVPVVTDAAVPGTDPIRGVDAGAADTGRGPGLRQPGCGCSTSADWDVWDAMLAVAVVIILEPLRRRRRR